MIFIQLWNLRPLIVFTSWKTGQMTIMKIPAEGGDHMEVSGISGFFPVPSPEGKMVYFGHLDEQSNTVWLWSAPIEGGKPTRLFEFPPSSPEPIRWRPDTLEVSYIVTKEGVDNIWSNPSMATGKDVHRFFGRIHKVL